MRRVPIRLKLGATLLVPVLALVVVAGLEMFAAANEVREVHDQAELATVTLGPPSLLLNIELERNAVSIYLLDQEAAVALSVENKEEAYDETDAAIEDFRDMVEGHSGFVADKYRPALTALDNLESLRTQVAEFTGQRGLTNAFARPVFDRYSEIMNAIYDANAQVVPTISNARLRRGAELADASAHQRDLTARILRELLKAQFEEPTDGVNTPAEIDGLARILGQMRRNAETIQTKAEGPYRPLADELFAKDHIREYPEVVQEVLDTGKVDIGVALNTSTGDESGGFGYTVFSKQVNEQLRADADDVRADADQRLRTYGVLALLAIALALITTWLVSKSLTRPLRALTQQATEMASTRLPNAVRSILNTPLGEDVEIPQVDPVRVKTRDEVGDVAEALNTVQETALELAVEQAVLRRNIADSFVNLGRRNQNLLGRQLDFITELESHETDPDTLASLFRLDHLATRMRRNAESLLVLAGIDPPRRWSAPVRLNDVIRAALGEVEDYDRVSVADVEPATVVGSAAADLAHLIAEFVENALTFSPPDQNVEIRGRHIDAGYTLAIIDNGFGMAPEGIERANRRLAGSESFTVAPSKYLGHYVAGNLAARHEVTLRLEQSPGSGVTALIHLGPDLVAGSDLDGTPTGQPVASVPLPSEVRNRKALAAVGANGNSPLVPDSNGHGNGNGNGNGHGPAAVAGVAVPGAAEAQPDGPPLMPTLNTGPVPLAPGLPPGLPGAVPGGNVLGTGHGAPGQPAVPAERTASGLTKRAPRNPAATAAVPQGELLDALSRHTAQGPAPIGLSPAAPVLPPLPSRTPGPTDGGPGARPGLGGPGSSGPATQVGGALGGGDGSGGPPPPSGPGGPPLPRRGTFTPGMGSTPGPRGGAFPPGTGSASDRPGPASFGPDGAAGPRGGGFLAAPPPLPSRPGPATPGDGAGGPGRPADSSWSAPGMPSTDRGERRPPTPRPAPATGTDPKPSGLTTGRLARRIPGANLPPTGPFTIKRGAGDGGAAAEPAGGSPAAGPRVPAEVRRDENHPRAETVYTLLTNFTLGVQRGLDEAAAPPPPPGDEERGRP